jgi:hypothetical protein
VPTVIEIPPKLRQPCKGPDGLPDKALPESATMDEVFAYAQLLAQYSVGQEAEIYACEVKRKGLIKLIEDAK